MILFIWGIIFVVVFIPGALIGWLIGKIPIPTLFSVFLAIGVCVGAAVVASIYMFDSADASLKFHFENLTMFLPPVLLSAIIGLWINRAKKRPATRPWHMQDSDKKSLGKPAETR